MVLENIDSVLVQKAPVSNVEIEIGPSKHAANALAGAFPLVETIILRQPIPRITDFQNFLKIYSEWGTKILEGRENAVVDNRFLEGTVPNENAVRSARATILLLSGALVRNGRVQMPMPQGDWPGSRPTSSVFEVIEKFGANLTVNNGHIDAKLKRAERDNRKIDVRGKVFATLASMVLASGVGGRCEIINPLSSLEVDNLAIFLKAMGVEVNGLDSSRMTVESEGLSKLKNYVSVDIFPDACETMFWIAFAKLHAVDLDLSFSGWNQEITLSQFGPLFDMRKFVQASHFFLEGRGQKARILKQDLGQVEPFETKRFHDKQGLPRDAAPVLAVVWGALDSISQYHDDKYGNRRIEWMTQLNSIGGDFVYYQNEWVTIFGNKKGKYDAPTEGIVLKGTDIRSAASLLLAATTSDIPIQVEGMDHIKRSYTDLEKKIGSTGILIR